MKGWYVFFVEDELHVPVKAKTERAARKKAARHVDHFDCAESLTAHRLEAIDNRAIGEVNAEFLMKKHQWWFTCSGCGRRLNHQCDDYSELVFQGEKEGLNDYENIYHPDCVPAPESS